MMDKQTNVSCPIHNCGCYDLSCDGVLPVHTYEDCQEHEDGETRLKLVCLKGDMPHELPNSYTQGEIDELCRQYEAKVEKRVADDTRAPTPPKSKKPKRGRIGSGLKGKRTERMASQLGDFQMWLMGNPIDERRYGCKVGERANQFWLSRQKTFDRDATRAGEKKGFGSAKALAAAYRNWRTRNSKP